METLISDTLSVKEVRVDSVSDKPTSIRTDNNDLLQRYRGDVNITFSIQRRDGQQVGGSHIFVASANPDKQWTFPSTEEVKQYIVAQLRSAKAGMQSTTDLTLGKIKLEMESNVAQIGVKSVDGIAALTWSHVEISSDGCDTARIADECRACSRVAERSIRILGGSLNQRLQRHLPSYHLPQRATTDLRLSFQVLKIPCLLPRRIQALSDPLPDWPAPSEARIRVSCSQPLYRAAECTPLPELYLKIVGGGTPDPSLTAPFRVNPLATGETLTLPFADPNVAPPK